MVVEVTCEPPVDEPGCCDDRRLVERDLIESSGVTTVGAELTLVLEEKLDKDVGLFRCCGY
jgi:hypothetical protein